MKAFALLLRWQFTLLQRNNIISISFAVTLIYGVILYFLRDKGVLDKVMVSLVLNDPSIIGYFFISLAIYTEINYGILPAIFVSPVNVHQILISKTASISIIGLICSLALAISVKGLEFDYLSYSVGALGICVLSALLGLIVLTFASEFLKFVLLSFPIFLAFINIPLLQYLGAFDMGLSKYIFPIQGCLDLIDYSISGTEISFWYSYISIIVSAPVFYWVAYHYFKKKVVHQ